MRWPASTWPAPADGGSLRVPEAHVRLIAHRSGAAGARNTTGSARRRPQKDLDAELAQLERESPRPRGAAGPAKPRPSAPAEPDKPGRIDAARTSGRSLLRKVVALVIIVAAGAILLKIAVGFIATIFWLVAAVLAIVAIIWAVRQL